MDQAGMLNFWLKKESTNPRKCLEEARHKKRDVPRLSLSHLSSAFIVLAIGCTVSALVFSAEIFHQYQRTARRRRNELMRLEAVAVATYLFGI